MHALYMVLRFMDDQIQKHYNSWWARVDYFHVFIHCLFSSGYTAFNLHLLQLKWNNIIDFCFIQTSILDYQNLCIHFPVFYIPRFLEKPPVHVKYCCLVRTWSGILVKVFQIVYRRSLKKQKLCRPVLTQKLGCIRCNKHRMKG